MGNDHQLIALRCSQEKATFKKEKEKDPLRLKLFPRGNGANSMA